MNSADLQTAFNEASSTLNNAHQCARVAVGFAAGKLRSMYLNHEVLRELKRELQGFNAKRGRWTN